MAGVSELLLIDGGCLIPIEICGSGEYAIRSVIEVRLQLRTIYVDRDHGFPVHSEIEGMTVHADALSEDVTVS